jgi:Ti-type conjugative transfer relaxase TraA
VAIYHLHAQVISRAQGRCVVAAAAYRAGQSLDDEASGLTFDYTRKQGIAFSEILAPEGAPEWVFHRSELWNRVEAGEKRKDAQLARELDVGLHTELSFEENRELLRAFVKREFVDKGMVADFSIHLDDEHNPHAHIMLTLRKVGPEGFGPKVRTWNERSKLMGWRQSWEELSNAHLAQAGHAVRIDHRTLKEQGLELTPGRKIGVGQERQQGDLPPRIAERVAEQREIARENGERIIADPGVALKAMTHMQATFTEHDLAKWLHTRTDGAEQFQAAYLKVTTSPDLVMLGRDDRRRARYTSREMLEVERGMLQNGKQLAARAGHGVEAGRAAAARSKHRLSAEQREAFDVLVAPGDLKALVGLAGSGKSRLLSAAKEAWEAQGYTVRGAALSGIAAENLAQASGIESRTLASFEYAWKADREKLHAKEVFVIDEAGMVGSRQFARVLEAAHKAGTKVVVVGDPEQLQAIEAGAPFRALLAESGVAELNEVRRQIETWQRKATQLLATGGTATALEAYEAHGGLVKVDTHEQAKAALIARWDEDVHRDPSKTKLLLAYTRDDVAALNALAREKRQQRGELGKAEKVQTERGEREFAVRDRLYFLRNEKSLGVKNGTLGTIEALRGDVLQVRLDAGERVVVDTRFYRDLDYGYAATVYKAQGSTVDRSYILATSHYDRHSAYVALSRHRETATMFYAAEDFPSRSGAAGDSEQAARERLFATLSRMRQKDLAHDYLDLEETMASPQRRPVIRMQDIEARQQQAAERWRERERARGRGLDSPGAKLHRFRSNDYSRGGPEEDFSP